MINTIDPSQGWTPSPAEVDIGIWEARRLSTEQLAGQVIVARYAGTDPSIAADLVSQYALAGVIYFRENVASLDQVIASSLAAKNASARLGRGWPAFVSTDNEGGNVQRLSRATGPWTTFPPFAAAGRAPENVVTTAMEAMARELRASGLTANFAPVADVTEPGDVTIRSRSASSDGTRAARAVTAAIAGFTRGGVLSSVKHFPGHGSLGVDSHQGLPVQDRSVAEMESGELTVFRAGVAAGVPMVMVGHIDVTAWDAGTPASLSPAAYHYLRSQLGFAGVAVTDGLDMGALTQARSTADIAISALRAGADLLLTPADTAEAHAAIVRSLADGSLPRARVEQAAGRVISMMRWQHRIAEASGVVERDDIATRSIAEYASFA